MRFKRLDLNLLVALDALLTERSVSQAADRIYLSQSATSSALGRLREYFGDELLVAKGRSMVLTTRAEGLIEPVRNVLQMIQSTIAVAPEFNPMDSDRTISVMASDYTTEVLLSSALQRFAVEAPRMRFEISPLNDNLVETLERGGVDLIITLNHAVSPDHPSEKLFEDDYVVLGWSENPWLQKELTEQLYFELGHVTVGFGKTRLPAFEELFLREQSRRRRVEVIAPSFLSVPGLLIGSQRIAMVHRRLANRLASNLPLVTRPVPFEMPRLQLTAQWHRSSSNDPAIVWLVERIRQVAAGESRPDPAPNVVPISYSRGARAARKA